MVNGAENIFTDFWRSWRTDILSDTPYDPRRTVALLYPSLFSFATQCCAYGRLILSCGVFLSGCMLRSCIVSKQVNAFANFSQSVRPIIPVFFIRKVMAIFHPKHRMKNRDFRLISRFISEIIQDDTLLLQNANRNSYAVSDPKPRFQDHANIRRWICQ